VRGVGHQRQPGGEPLVRPAGLLWQELHAGVSLQHGLLCRGEKEVPGQHLQLWQHVWPAEGQQLRGKHVGGELPRAELASQVRERDVREGGQRGAR